MAACRAEFILLPAWITLPITTGPTSLPAIPDRSKQALIAIAPSSTAGKALKDHKVKRLATVAKTERLRTARLALAVDALPKKPLRPGPIQRGIRSPLKI